MQSYRRKVDIGLGAHLDVFEYPGIGSLQFLKRPHEYIFRLQPRKEQFRRGCMPAVSFADRTQ